MIAGARPASIGGAWRYELHDGRILSWSLESHVVDHCNLRCASCCTLSPHLAPRQVEPRQLARELRLAREALRPSVFKVTGGEPLLHSDIAGVLQAVKDSGISEQLSMTTNGFLLPHAPVEVWKLLDRLTVSRYASAPLPPAILELVEARCREHGVILTTKLIDAFQRLDPDGPLDDARTREVHATCWLRHRCHAIYDGRFYPCTRPPHLESVLGRAGGTGALAAHDGVDLDGPELARRILALLEGEAPLRSCRHCLGSTGPWEPHRQSAVGPAPYDREAAPGRRKHSEEHP